MDTLRGNKRNIARLDSRSDIRRSPSDELLGYILGRPLRGTLLLVLGIACLLQLLKQLRSFVEEPEVTRKPGTETAAFIGH